MNMKSKLGMLTLAALAMGGMGMGSHSQSGGLTDEDLAELKRRQDKQRTLRHDEIKRGNGLLPFSTSGGEIWALNKKSAQRKCAKKGWVLYQ
jgi:hypothetical protein